MRAFRWASKAEAAKTRDNSKLTERNCLVCGKLFMPMHDRRRYCTTACSRKRLYAIQLTKARKLQALCNIIKMERGCLDCGYKLHPTALQFDHVRGVKIKEVSKFTDAVKMRAEIEKCEIRCANCHMIKTMERRMMKRALTPEQERDIQEIVRRLVTAGTLTL